MNIFINQMLLITMEQDAISLLRQQGHSIKRISEIQGKTYWEVAYIIRKYRIPSGEKSEGECKVCGKPLIGRQRMFCSRVCHNRLVNDTHQAYAMQKARGIERKKKLVEMFGGKCKHCGYDKNLSALEFHHIDPTTKDDGIDIRKMSNRSWEWCLTEAKKCEVLCANCHREVHCPSFTNWK